MESYRLLQPDPSDATLAVLKEISAQLNGYALTPPFLNATHATTPADLTLKPFQAPTSAVWLNTLWFSSLVFSIVSALLALFVKQWISEAMVGGTSRESARLRQYRLNGLLKWHVGAIVVIPPLLLQLASFVFLAGLLVLLWTLHRTVATIVSLLVAFAFTFFLVVTIIPVFRGDCSYRSPASFAIYVMVRYTRNEVLRVLRGICKVIYKWSMQWAVWIDVHRARFDRLGNFAYAAYDSLPTWRGRDQNAIYKHHGALNRAIVTSAYSTTAETKFVASMPVIFSDLPPDEVGECFADIMRFMEAEWGHWHLPDRLLLEDAVTLPLCAAYGIQHMLARSDKGSRNWIIDEHTIFRHYFMGKEHTEKLAELACKSLCHLAVEDREYRHIYGLAHRTLERLYTTTSKELATPILPSLMVRVRVLCLRAAAYVSTQLRRCTRWKWQRVIRLWVSVPSKMWRRPASSFYIASVQRSPATLESVPLRPKKYLHGASSNSPDCRSGCVAWSGRGCTRAVWQFLEMPLRSCRSLISHLITWC